MSSKLLIVLFVALAASSALARFGGRNSQTQRNSGLGPRGNPGPLFRHRFRRQAPENLDRSNTRTNEYHPDSPNQPQPSYPVYRTDKIDEGRSYRFRRQAPENLDRSNTRTNEYHPDAANQPQPSYPVYQTDNIDQNRSYSF